MAIKRITPKDKSIPIIINNHNRENPIDPATRASRVSKLRAKGKSVAQQVAENWGAKSTVIGRTLRGVRKV